MTADNITIPLKGIYFNQIKAKQKPFEYRLVNDFWTKRLIGKTYKTVTFTLGYPPKHQREKHLVAPWRGDPQIVEITHEEFGPDPVQVYAIPTH